jgi:molybdopterin synthase sulfur carrier subunit
VDNKEEVEVENATTVEEALDQLHQQYPKLKEQILDNNGELRKFINVYINDTDIRDKDGSKSNLESGDDISIIPSIAGGKA